MGVVTTGAGSDFATGAGALATGAGGAFATGAGALETGAGAFATGAGAFATGAGALATGAGTVWHWVAGALPLLLPGLVAQDFPLPADVLGPLDPWPGEP
jgi:hypothetical protein